MMSMVISQLNCRVPWVWPGGMFIRNGLNSGFNVAFGQPIFTQPQEWVANLASTASPTGDVDLFTEDFRYPQILRASLAMDKKLPWGLDGTAEITFTKTLNNMDVKQINIFPSTENLTGADDRPIINFDEKIDPTYENITLVDNTSEGYTFNITGQLSKQFNRNSSLNLAYSFTRAEALVDGRGFINNTNWLNILSVQGNNNPSVTRSTFDAGHRITAFFSHKFDYSDVTNTTISIFYTGKSGSPYSFVYNTSATSDISQSGGFNDLIYVPESAGEINLVDIDGGPTAAQQWASLDAFIEGNDYLSSRRGDYAEPNRVRTPFEGVLDLKLIQDIYFGGKNGGKRQNIQVTFDIFNFTNMINSNWGRRYFVGGNTFSLIQSSRNDNGELEYNFTAPNGDPFNIVQSGTYSARWNAQFGLRYNF